MITISHPLQGFVPALVRGWARLYCAGISQNARATRQIEIDSDLWEHYTDRLAQGANPATVGVEAFSRMLRGVPSDIAWRVQAEGFHVNIHFPIERIAGVFLLFLVIPFVAGSAISGYDTGRELWPEEFARFADMSSRNREITGTLHGIIGILMIAGVGILFATVRDRSPKLITVACALLGAAGTIMLVNAALYRTMSELADEYLRTSNGALVSNARALALTIEGLAIMNTTATTAGVLSLAVALSRLGMVPRWTLVFPVIGAAAPVMLLGLSSVLPDSTWWYIMIAFVAVALWLLIAGLWLLFGGSRGASPALRPTGTPA
jgi:hypothetical protein